MPIESAWGEFLKTGSFPEDTIREVSIGGDINIITGDSDNFSYDFGTTYSGECAALDHVTCGNYNDVDRQGSKNFEY